ncbi:hypothetical protein D3C71_907340 [compost metagenome]
MTAKLTDNDFRAAALVLGVPEASVRAVSEVESNGGGFLPDGRPKILFERHIFRRELLKRGVDTRALEQSRPDLVNVKTGGYKGGVAEWDRLADAININRTAALSAASWGRFQLMGFNWEVAGFTSVQDLVNAMYRSEGEHLMAFVRFIKADGAMHRALVARNWTDFARRYNGPSQKGYDTKMASAYARFARAAA